MRNIRFAFAIDKNHQFADTSFSMADFFQFYEYLVDNSELKLITEVTNPSLSVDDEQKYSCLIDFLNENKVDLLVARNYSTKLKVQCQFFVPVIVDNQLPVEQICNMLKRNIRWLIDELSLNKKENMVFNITNGIYKYRIEDEKRNKNH